MLAPQQPPQQPKASPVGMAPAPETNPIMPDGSPAQATNTIKPNFLNDEGPDETPGPTEEEVAAHLDSLPDDAKAFLAEHLTPEFVTAIGLISGEVVAQHLMKYADQDKVLVPVPRKVAEENLAAMKAQASGGQSQQATPQASPAPAPQGGMMAPMQNPATPQ